MQTLSDASPPVEKSTHSSKLQYLLNQRRDLISFEIKIALKNWSPHFQPLGLGSTLPLWRTKFDFLTYSFTKSVIDNNVCEKPWQVYDKLFGSCFYLGVCKKKLPPSPPSLLSFTPFTLKFCVIFFFKSNQ